MFKKLKVSDYQVIVITDGGSGAYAYNGKQYFYCPCFDGPVTSTLGAGDAFASTFCAALQKFDKDIAKECIKGLHGNGAARKKKITELGYNYNEVQKKVNELLK